MGVDADTEIKRITSLCQNPQDVCIVTYDNDIKRYVKKCGCQVIDPKAMYKTILETLNLNKGRRPKSEEPECKRNGPSEDDAKHWKDVFKTPPNDETTSAVEKKPVPPVKGKKPTLKTTDEPHYKYQGTPADEVQYWVRILKERMRMLHKIKVHWTIKMPVNPRLRRRDIPGIFKRHLQGTPLSARR